MAFERRRKQLLAAPRQWGDPISNVPHTCPSSGPLDLGRENFNLSASAAPVVEPDVGPVQVDDNDSLPLAGPQDPTYQKIPIPANTTMISTKGWTLDSLINKSINFHHARRVSALSTSLLQFINDYEKSGMPLVIEDCHQHSKWSKDEFTLESFASATSDDITVRNVHDWQDTVMPLSNFITKSRSIATLAEEGEQERFYGKDAQCPQRWEHWLQNAGVVPQSLLSGGPQDLFRYRPQSSPVETLMCYLGVGDTFTPCHKDLCASSGQNLMCHTENDGSSFWFMTESASAPEVAKYFHSLGRELDHEDYVITVEELSQAPFKVYIIEQKLGDLVIVPPRSAHQVVNFGGITVKTSWSRMTLKGLVEAYHYELPIYRRVCRPETYRVKSTIRYALLGLEKDLRSLLQHTNVPNSCDEDKAKRQKTLVSNIQEILVVFEFILAEEFETHRNEMPHRSAPNEANSDDEHIVCDFCGSDIFQSFLECRTCVEIDSAEGGYAVCSGCYAEGRACKCLIMDPMQRRQFKLLLDTREKAIQVVDVYEQRHGRTFRPSNDYCDLNNHSYPRTFRAACVLLDIYKKMKSAKVCTQSRLNDNSHNVPFPWALTCKMCHHAKCFPHILSEHRTHSVEALLLHNGDDTHQKYHHNHTAGRKARFEISAKDLISSSLGHQQLAYYAIHFTHCKPVKPQFMHLGWYDINTHSSYISDSDDQGSPSRAEMGSMLAPDTVVSVSTESSPVVVQPTSTMPNVTVKRTRKRKAFVLVPQAPYRLPDQGGDSQRRSQTISSTSAPLLTQSGPQHVVNRPGQRVPPLQEKHKASNAPTIFKPSTLTLSDIGMSIPTTVRKSGSFIIHTPGVVPRNRILAEETLPIDRPVGPIKPLTTRTSKPPHIANPVTTQVITKPSLSNLKFKKSRARKIDPPTSPSNDAAVAASTSAQGAGLKPPNLPESQPVPFPMPSFEPANVFPTEFAASFAAAFMHQVGSMLCQKTSNPGQPMNPFDTSSKNAGSPQTSYSHSQHYNGHPQQHNCQPPQRTGQSTQYNGQPPQYNGQPPQYNGQPPQYNGQPPQYNGPPPHYPPHYYPVHPQRYSNLFPYHAPSYSMASQLQFHQDSRRPPHNQAPMQFAGKMGYVNHQLQDEYKAHHNGRNKNKMPAQPNKPPYKKRKYNGSQDSQSQTRYPKNHRFNHGARPPQGPRGYKYHASAPNYSTSERVDYHDGIERSTSRDRLPRLPWGTTSSEGTPSVYSQSQSASGRGDYHQQDPFNPETSFRGHGGFDSFVEPKREGSAQHRANNHNAAMDITDVDSDEITHDSNDITRHETPLSMAVDPTFPTPQTEQDGLNPDDSLDKDDAIHASMDDLPVPIVGNQGNDQNWEDNYEIPEERAIQASAPETAPQLGPAVRGALDSMFNAADDSMADVTANPWTS